MTNAEAFRAIVESVRELCRTSRLPADLGTREIAPETRLRDLPIDSLAKMTLLAEIESRADVVLPMSEIAGMETVGDLATMVVRAFERG